MPKKGDVSRASLVCGGPFFDWPWWKRTLATIAHPFYVRYRVKRALRWRERNPGVNTAPLDLYIDNAKTQASSHIKPISWDISLKDLKAQADENR